MLAKVVESGVDTEALIQGYIESLPQQKRSDISRLHEVILTQHPGVTLWFLDGKDKAGKVVSNPSIGYGVFRKQLAGGKQREFYAVGTSANSTGLSVYVMGLEDKNYLKKSYGATIGKAEVTGYCIKFRTLKDVDLKTLECAIQDGMHRSRTWLRADAN